MSEEIKNEDTLTPEQAQAKEICDKMNQVQPIIHGIEDGNPAQKAKEIGLTTEDVRKYLDFMDKKFEEVDKEHPLYRLITMEHNRLHQEAEKFITAITEEAA